MQMNLFEKGVWKKSLPRTWPYYLVAIVLPSIALPYGFGLLTRPQGKELLTIFTSGTVNSISFTKEIEERFKGDYPLRQVDSLSSRSEDPIYFEKLTTAGFISSDIIIVPESILAKVRMSVACLPISAEIASTYLYDIDAERYEVDGESYGLLYKGGDKTYLDTYVTFNSEKQYLFFNASSAHVGEDGGDDLAFMTMRFLFGK